MKYYIAKEEKAHFEQTAVETVKCATTSASPDYLLGVKGNCFVRMVPAEVETPVRGSATLVAGTVTVANTTVTSTSVIIPVVSTIGGFVGTLSITKNAGVGFTITSTSNADTSTINWIIIN
jgi:hypothetical protein